MHSFQVSPLSGPCLLLVVCVQVTSDLADKVHDSYILKEIKGSDHAPLGIVIKKAEGKDEQ